MSNENFTAREEIFNHTVAFTLDMWIYKDSDPNVGYKVIHGVAYEDPIYNSTGMCIGYAKSEGDYDIINNDNILKFTKLSEPELIPILANVGTDVPLYTFDKQGNNLTHPRMSGCGHFVSFNSIHKGTSLEIKHTHDIDVELEVMIDGEKYTGVGTAYYYRVEGYKQVILEPITVLGGNLRHDIEILGKNNYHDRDKYLYGIYGIKKEDVAITNTEWVDEETYVLKSVEMKDGTIHELNKTLAKCKFANRKGVSL